MSGPWTPKGRSANAPGNRPRQNNIAQMFDFVKPCADNGHRAGQGRPRRSAWPCWPGTMKGRRADKVGSTGPLPGGPAPFMAWGAAARQTGLALPGAPSGGGGAGGRRGEPYSFLLHYWRCVALRACTQRNPKPRGRERARKRAKARLRPRGGAARPRSPKGSGWGAPPTWARNYAQYGAL